MRFALTLTLLSLSAPAPAGAENCVPKERVALEGGRPCMDVSTSFGRLGQTVHAGDGGPRFDLQLAGPRMMLLSNQGAAPRSIGVELFRWDGLDGDRSYAAAAAIRVQRDAPGWGFHAGVWVASRWLGRVRVLVPAAGLRLGRFDRSALLFDALIGGAALYSADGAGALDVDLSARATWAVRPWLRLEARGRARDVGGGEVRRRELWAAAGVEAAVAGPDGFRVMPLFLGVGMRRAADGAAAPIPEQLEHGPGGGSGHGWQLMATAELDMAIHSSRASWF